MTTLTELGDFMQGLGLGVQGGLSPSLFLGTMPDEPDTVLAIYELPGGAPEYLQNSYFPSAEMPRIQVVARAKRYDDASTLAARAWQGLAIITNASLNGVRYRSVRPTGSPAFLKKDTNDRTIMFFNAAVEKEVSVVTAS